MIPAGTTQGGAPTLVPQREASNRRGWLAGRCRDARGRAQGETHRRARGLQMFRGLRRLGLQSTTSKMPEGK